MLAITLLVVLACGAAVRYVHVSLLRLPQRFIEGLKIIRALCISLLDGTDFRVDVAADLKPLGAALPGRAVHCVRCGWRVGPKRAGAGAGKGEGFACHQGS